MSLVGFKAQNHPQQAAKPHVDDRALPPADFAALHARFAFTLDAAASAENAKLPRFYTREQDGLSRSWHDERVYCNPPYSSIEPWIEKAWAETTAPLVVLLLPANRTEQGWWQDLIEDRRDRPGSPLRVEFLRNRRRFLSPGALAIKPNERPPFGICLCIWDRPQMPVEAPRPYPDSPEGHDELMLMQEASHAMRNLPLCECRNLHPDLCRVHGA